MTRKCCICKQFLPLTLEYFYQSKTETYGLRRACKACEKSRATAWNNKNIERTKVTSKKWREENKDHVKAMQKARDTLRYHGITSEVIDLIYSAFDKCDICDKKLIKKNLDHNHKTGRIRGVLCNNCNLSIGAMRDNPEVLEKAAEYLRKTADP